MKIRIVETIAKSAPPAARRVDVVRAVLLPDSRQATPPAAMSSPQSGAFSSAAAFVNEWIGPGPKPALIPRDFTFKRVIGEPEW